MSDVMTSKTRMPHSGASGPAGLLLLQFATMWAAFFILAPSINWPASLDEPPAVILPLLLAHALALIPLAILLRDVLGLYGAMGRMVVALGVLAGFAKTFGIVRWLFLMPGLAAAYTDPSATPEAQAAIEVVYGAFNSYAGGVGELLGVGFFASVWTIVISVAALRRGWTWIGYAGFGAAALLLSTLLSVVGIESPLMLTLSGILWQFWTLALAITIWRKA